MLACDNPCSFFEGIDCIITKNQKYFGNPGSSQYKKSLIKKRKEFLNKWFSFFPGLHNNIRESCFFDKEFGELECKSEFFCLLLDIDKSENRYKRQLRAKLENMFDTLTTDANQNIYSILLFLILLQNVKNARYDDFFCFDNISTDSSYGSSESVPDFVNSFPIYLFSGDNLPDINCKSKMIIDRSIENGHATELEMPSFMTDLSNLCSIKRSTFMSCSSGYFSCVTPDNGTQSCESEEMIQRSSVVHYPFSHLAGKPPVVGIDFWSEEFLEEWRAFERGEQLPRRFVWEERGSNVGEEKPRLTEWNNSAFSVGSSAISLVLYKLRFNESFAVEHCHAILNSYSVPVVAWIKDLILLRLGVSSTTFKWDPVNNLFYLVAAPPKYISKQFETHIRAGTTFSRLCHLVNGKMELKPSVIRDGLINRLRHLVALHRESFSNLHENFASITEFSNSLLPLTNQIEYLGDLFEVNPFIIQSWPEHIHNSSPIKKGGLVLLKHLYQLSVNMVIREHLYVTFYLLDGCLEVILYQLHHWLFKGELFHQLNLQYTDDFLLFSDEDFINAKDSRWWQKQFILSDQVCNSKNNWVFGELSKEILRCGKSMKLLSLISQSNELLHSSQIIKCRPVLKLYNFKDDAKRNSIENYVKVVEFVAANALKSERELIEDKRKLSKVKALEAQKVREKFFKYVEEKRKQQQLEIYKKKIAELDRLKYEAEKERQRKFTAKDEEKMLDKLLLENNIWQNRKIIDELKSDLTKLYATKIADVQAREKFFLDKIEQSKAKLIGTNQSGLEIEIKNDQMQLNGNDNGNEQEIFVKEVREQSFDDSPKKISKNSLEVIEDKKAENNEINVPSHSIEQNRLAGFRQINTHGHTSDSTVEHLLYPDHSAKHHPKQSSLIDNHQEQFNQVNIHGHSSDSTVQNSLYPSSYSAQTTVPSNSSRINSQCHPSDSTIQNLMYPSQSDMAIMQTNNSNLVVTDIIDIDIPVTPNCYHHSASDWISDIQRDTGNKSRILQTRSRCAVSPATMSLISSFYTPNFPDSALCQLDRSILSDFESHPDDFASVDIESHPIDLLLKRSVQPIISAQLRLADSALMFSLLHEHRLQDHLSAIRKYILLEDGLFSSRLLPPVFHLITTADKINKPKLFDILKSALDCSHTDLTNCFCRFVHLIDHTPMDQSFHHRLDCFCLSYSVRWPLNIIIESRQIAQYQSIFRSIVQVKFASWSLVETRKIIDSWHSKLKAESISSTDRLRPFYSCLAEMEHWCRSIDASICSPQSSMGAQSWRRLIGQLGADGSNGECQTDVETESEAVSNLDSLIESHSACLNALEERCVLAINRPDRSIASSSPGNDSGSGSENSFSLKVRRDIHKMLVEMLELCNGLFRLVSMHHWSSSYGSSVGVNMRASELHRKFRKYAVCLLKVIRGAPRDSFLENFCSTLDFNQFYERFADV